MNFKNILKIRIHARMSTVWHLGCKYIISYGRYPTKLVEVSQDLGFGQRGKTGWVATSVSFNRLVLSLILQSWIIIWLLISYPMYCDACSRSRYFISYIRAAFIYRAGSWIISLIILQIISGWDAGCWERQHIWCNFLPNVVSVCTM